MFIAENLRSLRKDHGLTQEDLAAMLGISPQSISKWERGESYPDIQLLPALANIFRTSIDAIIGMDKINDSHVRNAIFKEGHEELASGNISAAIDLYSNALKTYPSDKGIISMLAIALALDGTPARLQKAQELCESLLLDSMGSKVSHTIRAALCFIYLKSGDSDKAAAAASTLPHMRESKEIVQEELRKKPSMTEIDAYIRFLALGYPP